MKKFYLFFCAILFLFDSFSANYYSKGNNTFNTLNNWHISSLVGGIFPTAFNVSKEIIIIQNGHTITSNVALAFNAIGCKIQIQPSESFPGTKLFTAFSIFQVDKGSTYYHNAAVEGTNGSSTNFPGLTGALSLSGGLKSNLRSSVHTTNLAPDMLVSGSTWSISGVQKLSVATGKTLTLNSDDNVETTPIVYCNCIRLIHQTLNPLNPVPA